LPGPGNSLLDLLANKLGFGTLLITEAYILSLIIFASGLYIPGPGLLSFVFKLDLPLIEKLGPAFFFYTSYVPGPSYLSPVIVSKTLFLLDELNDMHGFLLFKAL
jgi:hypothetical protein